MAKIQCELRGSFNSLSEIIYETVMASSATVSFEDESFFKYPNMKVQHRVFERYSMIGGNRVSLSYVLCESDGRIFFSAVTSAGSKATFFKLNTLGEEAFLEVLRPVVELYAI